MRKVVISRRNLPINKPWFPLVVVWLVADRFEVSGWVWLPVCLLMVILVFGYLEEWASEVEVGLEPDNDTGGINIKGMKDEETEEAEV